MNKYGIIGINDGQVSLTSFDRIIPSGINEECSPLFSVQVYNFPYIEGATRIIGERIATLIPEFAPEVTTQKLPQCYSVFSGRFSDAGNGKKVKCRNFFLRQTCGVDILEYVMGDCMDYSAYNAPERLKFRNIDTGEEGYASYVIEPIGDGGVTRVLPVNNEGIPQRDSKYHLVQYPDAPIGILLPLIAHNTRQRSRELVG